MLADAGWIRGMPAGSRRSFIGGENSIFPPQAVQLRARRVLPTPPQHNVGTKHLQPVPVGTGAPSNNKDARAAARRGRRGKEAPLKTPQPSGGLPGQPGAPSSCAPRPAAGSLPIVHLLGAPGKAPKSYLV